MKYISGWFAVLICFFVIFGFVPSALCEEIEDELPHCSCCRCKKGTSPPKEIKDGTVLTVQDCISIGLKYSPIIKEYKYQLDIAKSNVGIAKSAYFPTINAGAGYLQQNNSNKGEYYSLYRELPYAGASLSKMIWDFGKTSAGIKMEEFYKIGAEYEFMDSVCTTVFDIKTKYYELLKARSIYLAEQKNYEINEELIDEIKSLIKSGEKNNSDLLNAHVERLKIKNKLIEAENNLKNAKTELNNSMYFEDAPEYDISETVTYNNESISTQDGFKLVSYTKPYKAQVAKDESVINKTHFKFKEALQIAYDNSPDLQVLIAAEKAMEQALLVIKRSYYPELSADAGYNLVNTNHYVNNDFTVGVNLSASLNAQELKYKLKSASAQINLAQTEIDKFKKNLYFQVQKALNDVDKAEKEIPIAQQRLETAYDYLQTSKEDYKQDKINQLELQSAREAYYNSIIYCSDALYEYNTALINLEISMHYHLIDLHDRTEHAIKYHDEDIINNFNNIMDCGKHKKK